MADIKNYYVGSGIVSWQPLGTTGYVDLGNAPMFEFDPKNTRLAHFSSRLAHRFKDDERVIAAEPEVTFNLDEYTQYNIALALNGSMSGNTVNLMDLLDVRGSLQFVGANIVGPKKKVILPLVLLTPTGKLSLIDTTKYGELQFIGVVLGDPNTGSFGTIVDL